MSFGTGGHARASRCPARALLAAAIAACVGSGSVIGCKDFGDPVQPGGDSLRTITFAPAKDNTLYEDPQGTRSNGAGASMFAGTTSFRGGYKFRRALIAFDFADSIPAGATIRSVRLVLHMSRTVAPADTVSLHRVLASWGEGTSVASGGFGGGGGGGPAATGDATWLHRFFSTLTWSTPGGDFTPTPSAQIQVGGIDSYTWGSTPAMMADVESWLHDPGANYGWILVGEELSGIASAKRFDTREGDVAADRPRLVVEYTVPAQVASALADRAARPAR
jgi:hypothetical protein